MMTENITLTEEMRDEMFKYAVQIINEDSFSENNWTKLHDTLARKLESKNFVTQASVICRWKGLQQWIQKIVG